MASKLIMKEVFENLQSQMKQKLSSNRKILDHAPTKGDASELNWKEWLKVYLPSRYQVDKAFIIDCDGNISEQIDIVIYDQQYSPFVFNQDGAIYIPAESVYAVFEVKQELDKTNIDYGGKKIKSVRSLRRTSAQIVQAGDTITNPKPPFRIIGGILTLESSWSPKFGNPFLDAIKSMGEESSIDIGCCVSDGSFLVNYNDKVNIVVSSDNDALIFLFLNLLKMLQKIGTVRALEIDEYSKVLDKPTVLE